MSSLYPVTFTWTGTPSGMAGISTNGPVGVPFGCTPINKYQYFTFAFSQFGNGCPSEYSYNPVSTTCVYTADLYNSQTWGCTWTVADVSTSVVDGGPTPLLAGVPAIVTAPLQWVTVTSTQQITSTLTSIVDPGAVTVTVSATQGASKLRRGESPRNEARSGGEKALGEILEKPLNEPENDLVLAAFISTKGVNSTDPWLEDRALCPYTDQIYCGAGCCLDTQSCVGDGSVSCCNGFICVPFDANAPFVDYLHWSWNGFTATSTSVTYSTINPSGKTVTINGEISTTSIDFFVTKVVTSLVTSANATITITKFPSAATGAGQGIGGPGNSEGSAVNVTVGGQSSAAAVLNSSSSGGSSPNLGLKVGVGVGVPSVLAILGAFLFLIFRRRKSSIPAPAPNNPETSANNPNATAVNGRPVSEIPPDAANSMAAAGLGQKPEESVITSVSPGSELPARQYSVNRYYPAPSQSPGPQSTYSEASPPQQMAQVYVPPAGYQTQNMLAEQPPQQHQRINSMGYPQQNAGYLPQNQEVAAYPPQELGYQAQPEPMTYQAQPATGHEMYVPPDREGVMSYRAIPGADQYLHEAETKAKTHELS